MNEQSIFYEVRGGRSTPNSRVSSPGAAPDRPPGRGWIASTRGRMSIRSRFTPIWPGDRAPAVAMLAGFAALAGGFLTATTGGLLVDGFDPGWALTTPGTGLLPGRPRRPQPLAGPPQAVGRTERGASVLRPLSDH